MALSPVQMLTKLCETTTVHNSRYTPFCVLKECLFAQHPGFELIQRELPLL